MHTTELSALGLLMAAAGAALLLHAYKLRRTLSVPAGRVRASASVPRTFQARLPERIPTRTHARSIEHEIEPTEHIGAERRWSPLATIGTRPTDVTNVRRDDAQEAMILHAQLNTIERQLSIGLERVLTNFMAALDTESQLSAIKADFSTAEYAVITTLPARPRAVNATMTPWRGTVTVPITVPIADTVIDTREMPDRPSRRRYRTFVPPVAPDVVYEYRGSRR